MEKINNQLLVTLRKFIRPLARNVHDTEDILQNVLLKIMKNGDAISAAKFLPWIQTVCRSTAIDYYRKNKTNFSEINQADEIIEEAEENTSLQQLSNCIQPLLKNLKPDDYLILKSIELEGVPQNELAEKMNVNYSALKSKVQRARQKLKDEILQCCSVQLDKRNSPIDFKTKKKSQCC